MLFRNKRGKVVSKRTSANGRRRYQQNIEKWSSALKTARKALGIEGFVAINGKASQGKALYVKAKA